MIDKVIDKAITVMITVSSLLYAAYILATLMSLK